MASAFMFKGQLHMKISMPGGKMPPELLAFHKRNRTLSEFTDSGSDGGKSDEQDLKVSSDSTPERQMPTPILFDPEAPMNEPSLASVPNLNLHMLDATSPRGQKGGA
eukprot:TRINITY_DN66579_c0_g1_i1.p1 TRINITY_DN66579_c0_g1~~TRINITY_DN66579_c0_g1_i1.p1  ORF type:complete len:107 (-),score=26.32 TRINITY_DN66579_c0_g1_i1:157-477(-)